jgi:transcriptional regulator with XRE-family HTH domain
MLGSEVKVMPYGATIKKLREKAGFSQAALGAQLGVSSQAVSKWETNKAEPDSDAIKKMCEIFNVTSDMILGIELSKNESKPSIDDDDIKFALFGVDPANITDAQFEEVKRFAQYIRDLQSKQNGK